MDLLNFLFEFKINGYDVATVFWNLFLLIIPFTICSLLGKLGCKTNFQNAWQISLGVMLGLLWLIFIPNTAYVITDLRHITGYCPSNYYRVCAANAWMIVFFFTYAIIGWISFVYAINQMRSLLVRFNNRALEIAYRIGIIPIMTLGVMMGLLNRNNSWELFIYPRFLAGDLALYFTRYIYFKNWFLFTIFFFILYWLGNAIFIDIGNLKRKILSR